MACDRGKSPGGEKEVWSGPFLQQCIDEGLLVLSLVGDPEARCDGVRFDDGWNDDCYPYLTDLKIPTPGTLDQSCQMALKWRQDVCNAFQRTELSCHEAFIQVRCLSEAELTPKF